MRTTLSVIVVNWNTRDLLMSCLRSLFSLTISSSTQVIVVDNDSSDGSATMVRDRFPQVKLIANASNLGFAAANNVALAHTSGDVVLFLNPDTEVRPGAIEAMLQYLSEHPGVGVLGTTLLNPDGSLQLSCHHYYSLIHSLMHNRLADAVAGRREFLALNRGERAVDVDWMTGACLMIRESVLDVVGYFDPAFFVYGEEIDLQYRVKRAGYRVVFLPSPGIVHHVGQSAKQAVGAASMHDYRGRWLFVRKHYPAPSAGGYLAKTIAALVVWTLYWGAMATLRRASGDGEQVRAYGRLLGWHLIGRPSLPAPVAAARQGRG
jgi:GT2 family glycosyltransferase